ncbi:MULTISPECIES: alpha/beta fold hydrolase [unclassified Caballeronia]|uniref:alpha/beta hydrolase n=1 Tax=unclassified Caballeronia TaxID=2646786 RepID=UPI00285972E2|nr:MULTISPECIES: alpha/beta fold hydrolase [unclassified Caballeronia]MDR5817528.1 alpha/beta fold hydrolase [Caballeronia sp. LZ033]MDR5824473.1 alpha/beta fold hydrolase [Caballeronia sp. LZ043]MDR5882365.1 alpha/beta fold hydrolase [Caballeronia sp. LZ032]
MIAAFWTLLAVLAALYAIALGGLYWLQGRLVYPLERIQTFTSEQLEARTEPMQLKTEDGLNLTLRYASAPDSSLPTVILFHGNGEDLFQRAHIALELINAGYGVLLAEYRGYGGNPGKPSEPGLYADARAAYSFVSARSKNIVLHGYSLGSGVAVQLASEQTQPLTALILEAPFTSIVDVAARRFPLFPVRTLARDRYDSLAKIASVRVPLLIYGGTADGVIPPDQFQRLYDAARSEKRIALIEGADHLNVWTQGGRDHVMQFLASLPATRAERV